MTYYKFLRLKNDQVISDWDGRFGKETNGETSRVIPYSKPRVFTPQIVSLTRYNGSAMCWPRSR
jgi:hypothetical protein